MQIFTATSCVLQYNYIATVMIRATIMMIVTTICLMNIFALVLYSGVSMLIYGKLVLTF
jgi:hypothetical protein